MNLVAQFLRSYTVLPEQQWPGRQVVRENIMIPVLTVLWTDYAITNCDCCTTCVDANALRQWWLLVIIRTIIQHSSIPNINSDEFKTLGPALEYEGVRTP